MTHVWTSGQKKSLQLGEFVCETSKRFFFVCSFLLASESTNENIACLCNVRFRHAMSTADDGESLHSFEPRLNGVGHHIPSFFEGEEIAFLFFKVYGDENDDLVATVERLIDKIKVP